MPHRLASCRARADAEEDADLPAVPGDMKLVLVLIVVFILGAYAEANVPDSARRWPQ
jgi:hypothetical protein